MQYPKFYRQINYYTKPIATVNSSWSHHYHLKGHIQKLGLGDSSTYSKCQNSIETVLYIVPF